MAPFLRLVVEVECTMAPVWKWYGVKTVYRLEPAGPPEATDKDFWGEGSLVEERIVVFRARTFSEAIRKAEREATAYAASIRDRNPYGQRLVTRYLGACDAYEMTDAPLTSGSEVFSMTELVRRSVKDDAVVDKRLGCEESVRDTARRKNFCLLLFNAAVKGVKPTRAEIVERRRLGLLRRREPRS